MGYIDKMITPGWVKAMEIQIAMVHDLQEWSSGWVENSISILCEKKLAFAFLKIELGGVVQTLRHCWWRWS